MLRTIGRAGALALTVLWAGGAAAQAPPASCAGRFVGVWVYPGGSTTVLPDGTARPSCPLCVPLQSWTCNGNTYLFSNSGPPGQFTATLVAPDQMSYGAGVATRVGGGVAPAARARPRQTTGASRWLPPGSPNAEPAAQPPPRNPFGGDLHWGNPAVNDPGPRIVQPGQGGQGLSDRRRRAIDRLRNDRRALERYVSRLPPRERQHAWEYVGQARRDTQVSRLGGDTVTPPSVRIGPPGQTFQTNLEECRRAAQSGRPPPPGCNVQAIGGGPCAFSAGCTSMTCSVHLQYLQIRVVPRLSREGIIAQMSAAGCGASNFCYVPRPGTAQVCGRG